MPRSVLPLKPETKINISIFNNRLAQLRGEAQPQLPALVKSQQVPRPSIRYPRILAKRCFSTRAMAARFTIMSATATPSQHRPNECRQALLVQILNANAAQAKEAAKHLAAPLQLLQQVQAAHATEENKNNTLAKSFLAQLSEGSCKYPGSADGASKRKEKVTSFTNMHGGTFRCR